MSNRVMPRAASEADSHDSGAMRLRAEDGMALILALMMVLLLSALGVALVFVTNTETAIASNYRNAGESMYAADAAVEVAMQDLLTVPDWNTILQGQITSAFIDGNPSGARTLPDGSAFDITQATNMINCGHVATCTTTEMNTSTLDRPWGANNPRWAPYAYGPVGDMVPTGTINSSTYVVVWVADDPSENDNDPTIDGSAATNPGSGVLSIRSEAFGLGGAHQVIEATVAKTDTTEIERGYTGQRGQDEQNRRARKAAVQTPGKALTRQELDATTGVIQ